MTVFFSMDVGRSHMMVQQVREVQSVADCECNLILFGLSNKKNRLHIHLSA